MTTLVLEVDERTDAALRKMSGAAGVDTSELASRLLRRAVLRARIWRVLDTEAIREADSPFDAEDLALAESDIEHRSQILRDEDLA